VSRWLAALLVGSCASLHAQEGSLVLDLGGARVQQTTVNGGRPGAAEDQRAVPATIGSLRGRYADRWWLVGADLSGTLAADVTAAQAIGLATVAPVAWAHSDLAYSLTSIGLGPQGTSRTGGVTLRQHLNWREQLGLWVQGDRSTSTRFTNRFATDATGATAWFRSGPIHLWGGAQRVWTNDGALLLGGEALLRGAGRPLRYTDLTGGMRASVGRVDVAVSARQRRGVPAATPTADDARVVGDARVSLRLTSSVALDASYAQQLADPLRGAPEARVTTLLLRLQRSARVRTVTWSAVDGGAEVLIRVRGSAPAEVTGSFADWEPRAMTRDGRGYLLRLRLPSGTHHLAIRRAGGAWRAPDGLPRTTDDFGGESGLLVIP
jgi:hypothetical protein